MSDHKTQNTYSTRYTLIERIQNGDDHEAWEDFVGHYKPFIYFLLNQMEIHTSDQDDMVQEILIRLHNKVGQYIQERALFRSWLGSVIKNTVKNCLDKNNRRRVNDNEVSNSLKILESYSMSEFEERTEQEWKEYITNQAIEQLRPIFSESMVECFRLTLNNVPVEEIAKQLNIKKETVYIIRTRMGKRVMLKMQELIRELEFNYE